MKKLKKGGINGGHLFFVYGRFLSTKMISRPTTIMATNRPAIAGTKYRSAIDCVGGSVGAGVAAAGSTANAVSAYDGQ